MCGIFGIIGKESENINIKACLDSLFHRGPDDEGEYSDERIHLGFRRLSIIDLSHSGHQPMSDFDKKIWIVFNGEIYNYLELKRELEEEYNFISNTDTEVLIYGYKKWGLDKLLEKLNGMFAFCLYDKRVGISYLVRDRIGKKPLYYFCSDGFISFSSEVKSFFKLKNFSFEIDKDSFDLFMGFSYLPNNQKTLLKNVRKVVPGSYIKIENGKIKKISYYWHLPNKNVETNFSRSKKDLEEILIDSVKKRLVADVPVGILLSGGLDSSLITALASKYSKLKIKTINISFENSEINEREYAKIVSNLYKTSHTELILKTPNIYKTFKDNIGIFDDLSTVDGGLFSTFLMGEKIRELGVKVVLVGEGADEIFGGYSWFQLSRYPFKILPGWIKSIGYYYAIMRTLPSKNLFRYAKFLKKRLNETSRNFFYKIQEYEIKYSLPNHYCMKIDKGTMAASIEARAPYLDYRVVEMANQMKDNFMINGKFFKLKKPNEKFILRKIAEKYLPEKIYKRKKLGGMLPVYEILNEGLKNDSNLILENKFLTDFFTKNYLNKLINKNPKSKIFKWQREWILWKCLTFALWFDYFKKYEKN